MTDSDRLEQLIALIREYRYRELSDWEAEAFVNEIHEITEHHEIILEYLETDMPNEVIAEMALKWPHKWPVLTRDEMTQLVNSLTEPRVSEAEGIIRTLIFKANCIHPAGSDLIFYPMGIFGTNTPPTESIVDAAITGIVDR